MNHKRLNIIETGKRVVIEADNDINSFRPSVVEGRPHKGSGNLQCSSQKRLLTQPPSIFPMETTRVGPVNQVLSPVLEFLFLFLFFPAHVQSLFLSFESRFPPDNIVSAAQRLQIEAEPETCFSAYM